MNIDIRLSVFFFDHPKTVKLKRRLGLDGVESLIRLWAWTALHKPEGNLGGDIDDIEIAARWEGEPGALVSELDALRWIDRTDNGYVLHDWKEHNAWAADAEARGDEARLSRLFRTNPEKANEFKEQGRTGITAEEYQAHKTSTKKHDRSTDEVRPNNDRTTECSTPAPAPAPAPAPSSETFQVKVTESSSVRGGVGEIQKTTDDGQDFFELTPGRLRMARDRGFTDEAWLRAETEKFIDRNQGQSIKDPDRAWLAWLEAGRRMGIAIRDKPFVGRKPDSSGYVSRGAVL